MQYEKLFSSRIVLRLRFLSDEILGNRITIFSICNGTYQSRNFWPNRLSVILLAKMTKHFVVILGKSSKMSDPCVVYNIHVARIFACEMVSILDQKPLIGKIYILVLGLKLHLNGFQFGRMELPNFQNFATIYIYI